MNRRIGRGDQSRRREADIIIGNITAFASLQFYFAITERGTDQTHQRAFFEMFVGTIALLRTIKVKSGRFSSDRENFPPAAAVA